MATTVQNPNFSLKELSDFNKVFILNHDYFTDKSSKQTVQWPTDPKKLDRLNELESIKADLYNKKKYPNLYKENPANPFANVDFKKYGDLLGILLASLLKQQGRFPDVNNQPGDQPPPPDDDPDFNPGEDLANENAAANVMARAAEQARQHQQAQPQPPPGADQHPRPEGPNGEQPPPGGGQGILVEDPIIEDIGAEEAQMPAPPTDTTQQGDVAPVNPAVTTSTTPMAVDKQTAETPGTKNTTIATTVDPTITSVVSDMAKDSYNTAILMDLAKQHLPETTTATSTSIGYRDQTVTANSKPHVMEVEEVKSSVDQTLYFNELMDDLRVAFDKEGQPKFELNTLQKEMINSIGNVLYSNTKCYYSIQEHEKIESTVMLYAEQTCPNPAYEAYKQKLFIEPKKSQLPFGYLTDTYKEYNTTVTTYIPILGERTADYNVERPTTQAFLENLKKNTPKEKMPVFERTMAIMNMQELVESMFNKGPPVQTISVSRWRQFTNSLSSFFMTSMVNPQDPFDKAMYNFFHKNQDIYKNLASPIITRADPLKDLPNMPSFSTYEPGWSLNTYDTLLNTFKNGLGEWSMESVGEGLTDMGSYLYNMGNAWTYSALAAVMAAYAYRKFGTAAENIVYGGLALFGGYVYNGFGRPPNMNADEIRRMEVARQLIHENRGETGGFKLKFNGKDFKVVPGRAASTLAGPEIEKTSADLNEAIRRELIRETERGAPANEPDVKPTTSGIATPQVKPPAPIEPDNDDDDDDDDFDDAPTAVKIAKEKEEEKKVVEKMETEPTQEEPNNEPKPPQDGQPGQVDAVKSTLNTINEEDEDDEEDEVDDEEGYVDMETIFQLQEESNRLKFILLKQTEFGGADEREDVKLSLIRIKDEMKKHEAFLASERPKLVNMHHHYGRQTVKKAAMIALEGQVKHANEEMDRLAKLKAQLEIALKESVGLGDDADFKSIQSINDVSELVNKIKGNRLTIGGESTNFFQSSLKYVQEAKQLNNLKNFCFGNINDQVALTFRRSKIDVKRLPQYLNDFATEYFSKQPEATVDTLVFNNNLQKQLFFLHWNSQFLMKRVLFEARNYVREYEKYVITKVNPKNFYSYNTTPKNVVDDDKINSISEEFYFDLYLLKRYDPNQYDRFIKDFQNSDNYKIKIFDISGKGISIWDYVPSQNIFMYDIEFGNIKKPTQEEPNTNVLMRNEQQVQTPAEPVVYDDQQKQDQENKKDSNITGAKKEDEEDTKTLVGDDDERVAMGTPIEELEEEVGNLLDEVLGIAVNDAKIQEIARQEAAALVEELRLKKLEAAKAEEAKLVNEAPNAAQEEAAKQLAATAVIVNKAENAGATVLPNAGDMNPNPAPAVGQLLGDPNNLADGLPVNEPEPTTTPAPLTDYEKKYVLTNAHLQNQMNKLNNIKKNKKELRASKGIPEEGTIAYLLYQDKQQRKAFERQVEREIATRSWRRFLRMKYYGKLADAVSKAFNIVDGIWAYLFLFVGNALPDPIRTTAMGAWMQIPRAARGIVAAILLARAGISPISWEYDNLENQMNYIFTDKPDIKRLHDYAVRIIDSVENKYNILEYNNLKFYDQCIRNTWHIVKWSAKKTVNAARALNILGPGNTYVKDLSDIEKALVDYPVATDEIISKPLSERHWYINQQIGKIQRLQLYRSELMNAWDDYKNLFYISQTGRETAAQKELAASKLKEIIKRASLLLYDDIKDSSIIPKFFDTVVKELDDKLTKFINMATAQANGWLDEIEELGKRRKRTADLIKQDINHPFWTIEKPFEDTLMVKVNAKNNPINKLTLDTSVKFGDLLNANKMKHYMLNADDANLTLGEILGKNQDHIHVLSNPEIYADEQYDDFSQYLEDQKFYSSGKLPLKQRISINRYIVYRIFGSKSYNHLPPELKVFVTSQEPLQVTASTYRTEVAFNQFAHLNEAAANDARELYVAGQAISWEDYITFLKARQLKLYNLLNSFSQFDNDHQWAETRHYEQSQLAFSKLVRLYETFRNSFGTLKQLYAGGRKDPSTYIKAKAWHILHQPQKGGTKKKPEIACGICGGEEKLHKINNDRSDIMCHNCITKGAKAKTKQVAFFLKGKNKMPIEEDPELVKLKNNKFYNKIADLYHKKVGPEHFIKSFEEQTKHIPSEEHFGKGIPHHYHDYNHFSQDDKLNHLTKLYMKINLNRANDNEKYNYLKLGKHYIEAHGEGIKTPLNYNKINNFLELKEQIKNDPTKLFQIKIPEQTEL